MHVEFNVGAASAVDFSHSWYTEAPVESKTSQFHEKIFSPPLYPTNLSRKVEPEYLQSLESIKTDSVFKKQLGIPLVRIS